MYVDEIHILDLPNSRPQRLPSRRHFNWDRVPSVRAPQSREFDFPRSEKCPEASWRCESGQCVATEERCNGVTDCHDATDELDCPLPFQQQQEPIQMSIMGPTDIIGNNLAS